MLLHRSSEHMRGGGKAVLTGRPSEPQPSAGGPQVPAGLGTAGALSRNPGCPDVFGPVPQPVSMEADSVNGGRSSVKRPAQWTPRLEFRAICHVTLARHQPSQARKRGQNLQGRERLHRKEHRVGIASPASTGSAVSLPSMRSRASRSRPWRGSFSRGGTPPRSCGTMPPMGRRPSL
jgi:hypothetical protein